MRRWPILTVLLAVGCQFDTTGPGVVVDGSLIDADPTAIDGASIDGAPACPAADSATLALYRFDDDVGGTIANDDTTQHDGTITGTPAFPTGPCGVAIEFPAASAAEVIIPDHTDWDLSIGSFDLWLRMPPLIPDSGGVVGRDASGIVKPGHIAFHVTDENRVYIRIQNAIGSTVRCSDRTFAPGTWIHVGVNWGAPDLELWIDGATHNFIGQIPFNTTTTVVDCLGATNNLGIDGNDNPWVFGMSAGLSDEDSANNTTKPLVDGAIDHLRISSARRDFSVE